MQFSITILQKERDKIISDLKSGQQERLKDLQDIDKALGWLRLLMDSKWITRPVITLKNYPTL